jgi:hypothetical protein
MDFMYTFEVGFKDGTVQKNEYTLKPDTVAHIRFIPKNALCPPFFFFFTKGNLKLKKFYGKGFLTPGRGNDYYYCIFTDKFRCYINAYEGDMVFTDDLSYKIKSKYAK